MSMTDTKMLVLVLIVMLELMLIPMLVLLRALANMRIRMSITKVLRSV